VSYIQTTNKHDILYTTRWVFLFWNLIVYFFFMKGALEFLREITKSLYQKYPLVLEIFQFDTLLKISSLKCYYILD